MDNKEITEADLRASHKYLAERLQDLRSSAADLEERVRACEIAIAVGRDRSLLLSGIVGTVFAALVNLIFRNWKP